MASMLKHALLMALVFAILSVGCTGVSVPLDLDGKVAADLPMREDFLKVLGELLQAQESCRFSPGLKERILPSNDVNQKAGEPALAPCIGAVQQLEILVNELPELGVVGVEIVVESRKNPRNSEFFIPAYFQDGKWYFSWPQVLRSSLHS